LGQDIYNHTKSGAHPASYSIGPRAPSTKSKAVQAQGQPPSSAEVAFIKYDILVLSQKTFTFDNGKW
jgi:hypothetical protein